MIPGVNYMVENLDSFTVSEDYPYYHVAMSLETAEHLDPGNDQHFVDQLTSLASHVVFSAAIPHQGGKHHVNEQWPSYWAELFANNGYECNDCIRPKIWDNQGVEWWYRQNILCFDRTNKPIDRCVFGKFDLVHPENYLSKIKK
jgi:hypothetical protein